MLNQRKINVKGASFLIENIYHTVVFYVYIYVVQGLAGIHTQIEPIPQYPKKSVPV